MVKLNFNSIEFDLTKFNLKFVFILIFFSLHQNVSYEIIYVSCKHIIN